MPSVVVAVVIALAMVAPGALAQRADSVRQAPVTIPRTVIDTTRAFKDTTPGPMPERRPPLSPGRSFAYSFLVPGYAQTVLGRPKASALFIAFEAVAFTMLRQAQFDLRQAQHAGADSLVVSWWSPAGGQVGPQMQASPYDSTLIRSRRAHVEDWVAVMIANHLFSGLDAYVSANLWDVPAELTVHSGAGGSTQLGLNVRVP